MIAIEDIVSPQTLDDYMHGLSEPLRTDLADRLVVRSLQRVLLCIWLQKPKELWFGGDGSELSTVLRYLLTLESGAAEDLSLISIYKPSDRDFHPTLQMALYHLFRELGDNALEQISIASAATYVASAAKLLSGQGSALTLIALNLELYWKAVQEDIRVVSDGRSLSKSPLWGPSTISSMPPLFETAWNKLKGKDSIDSVPNAILRSTFWIDWYQSVLDGKPMNPEMLLEIVHIRKEGEDYDFLWTKDPAEANRRVMDIYRRYYPVGGTPLAKANVTDFQPNDHFDWMEMIGLPADLDHIRDAEAVQAFMDDIGDLKDRFEDFADYTAELRGQRNIGGVLSRNADKIMDVLRHAEDKDHLKARRLVELGGDLFYWSLEEKTRGELGVGLCRQLDSALNRLKDVCRRHLGP
ncbi:MAG: hypothetical protein AAGH17_09810, partial [Pseudomonadota bacterium]